MVFDLALLGCCLVSLHFQCDILALITVVKGANLGSKSHILTNRWHWDSKEINSLFDTKKSDLSQGSLQFLRGSVEFGNCNMQSSCTGLPHYSKFTW